MSLKLGEKKSHDVLNATKVVVEEGILPRNFFFKFH
jgi:hypothetical protein